MSYNEAVEDKAHGDGSRETQPNQQEVLEPYRPLVDPVSPPPSGHQWCPCGSVPPPSQPSGIVCVQYHIVPTIDSHPDHPAHGGQRASTEDTGHQGVGRVDMKHVLQPVQTNPPMPQPWCGYNQSGCLPVPPLCYCGNLPPRHHPYGIVYLPYPGIPPADNRSNPDHPTHGEQHAASTEDNGHKGAGKVEMQHTLQHTQPNPPVPQPECGYAYISGYQPLPLFCYCGNIPPHRHPNGMVYMSYPNKSPADIQHLTEYPIRDAQRPSVEDSGQHRAGKGPIQSTTQQNDPIPLAPPRWSENDHSGYPPLPPLCYCCKLPPHFHPYGSVYLPHPDITPADNRLTPDNPTQGGQHAVPTEDTGHHGAGKVEIQNILPQMKPNPPEQHPLHGYHHFGYLPLPICYCVNIPHHHPGGIVYMPYPKIPLAYSRSRPDHTTHGGQHAVSAEEKERQGQTHHTTQPMTPNPPVPQPWRAYPHSGYLPVPPSPCFCENLPPHHHPDGSVYVSYPARPPDMPTTVSQSDSHPNHCGQHPVSTEDKGHQAGGKMEIQHAIQPMQPNPLLPQPWSGCSPCVYQPFPLLTYCCSIPPHPHPAGMALMSHPNRPPEDSEPKTEYPIHDGQQGASLEDSDPQRVVTSQMQHTTQPMTPNPSVLQPWRVYPHSGYPPVPPLPCFCDKLPPHHHPGGIVHVPYPQMPCTEGQP